MDKTVIGPGWRRALPALLLLWGAILWLYRDTGAAMVSIWDRSETYAHAWVVPPLTLWMIWRLRHQVLALRPRPALWVLVPVVGASILWLLGELVAVHTATQFALVALLVLAVPALLGLAVTRALLFPLAFLFFMVPAGDFLTPILMQWTADVTIAALQLSGIPVYREGLLFVIPSGTWSVVEACSGMRYLIASLMVGTLFAYLNYQSTRKRVIFMLVSLVVPILANWLRAYMIVMLGHLSNNQIAAGADHLVYGWLLFGIIILTLYWIGARWAEAAPALVAAPAATGHWPVAGGGLAVALLALVALAPLQLLRHIEAGTSDAPVVLSLPEQLPGGWQQAADKTSDPTPNPGTGWRPGFLNPSAEARLTYQAAEPAEVAVYVAYYRHQSDQRKLVSSANRVSSASGTDWNLLPGAKRKLTGTGGVTTVHEHRLVQTDSGSASQRRQLRVWQLYWVDGQWLVSDVAAKLHGAFSRLMGRGDDSAVILLSADDSSPAAADAALARFVASGLPGLRLTLDGLRRSAQAD